MKEKENKCISPHGLGIVGNEKVSHSHKSKRGEPRREEGYGVWVSEIDRAQNPEVSSSSGKDGRECRITSEKETCEVVGKFVEECREEIPERKKRSPLYKARDHKEDSKDEEGFLFHLFKFKEGKGMSTIELLAFIVIGYIAGGAFLLWWLERDKRNAKS